ncbi:hypothetical protein Agau_C201678 [Agrobacterium tumefaciens F2]|nr:hypothetical protein Agau_C201678 [Agrobacterium tumefaciens F2]
MTPGNFAGFSATGQKTPLAEVGDVKFVRVICDDPFSSFDAHLANL